MAISEDEALALLNEGDEKIFGLLSRANEIRKKYKGNKVKLCAIVNAKSGLCSENCNFCAQSAHHKTSADIYPLLSEKEIFDFAKKAEDNMGATCFSVVTSGKGVTKQEEIERIKAAVSKIKGETGLNRCVSLGILNRAQIKELKQAGLKKLHHNLETAESFFPKMCTTHTFKERLDTLRIAKEEGLEVCSGGIFGLGETLAQRIELAFCLKELDVQSVPINILNPIKGTPAFENHKPMSPYEVLRLIAVYRLIFDDKDIGLFGGREKALKTLQPLLFIAGANVILVGDYLTTKGAEPNYDLQMIKDLGLEVENN